MKTRGFTLIELLVVISIIGILLGLSIFGLQGARESSRDAKRKADIETIRSALELFRADCGHYPGSSGNPSFLASPLVGDDSSTKCDSSNVYLNLVPTDPTGGGKLYRYSPAGSPASTYELCAALEAGGVDVTCGGSSSCGSGVTCNYKAINP